MGTSASQGCNARHHSKACLELANIHLMRNNATDRHSKGTEGERSEREEGEGRMKERKKREERERENSQPWDSAWLAQDSDTAQSNWPTSASPLQRERHTNTLDVQFESPPNLFPQSWISSAAGPAPGRGKTGFPPSSPPTWTNHTHQPRPPATPTGM